MSNIYYSQNLSEKKFLRKKIWKNALALKSKKVPVIFRETLILGLLSSAVFNSTKPCLRFLLICFAQNIKAFYHRSSGNEVDFRDIMNVSPNI